MLLILFVFIVLFFVTFHKMVINTSALLNFFADPVFRRQYLIEAANHEDINMIEMARVDIAAYLAGHRSFLHRCEERRNDLLDRIIPAMAARQAFKIYSKKRSSARLI